MSSTITDFNNLAQAQLGVPYVFGGVNLAGTANPGLDCSGLPYAVSLRLGKNIPRTSEAQYAGLPAVSTPRRGDLVLLDVPEDTQPQPAHVVIWWSPTTVLQAPRTGEDVMFSPTLPYQVMGYRRLPFPDAAPPKPPAPKEYEIMDSTTAPNGDIVSHAVTPQGHYLEITRKANQQGTDAHNGLSIIDITAAFGQFQVQP